MDLPPQPPPQWLPPPNMQQFQQQFQMPWWPMQQQHPQAPPRVTLTPFWPSAPAAWFRLAEATFHRLHVIDPNLMFDLTLPALQESTVAQLQDILQAADNLPNPYEALKAELIRQHSPNVLEQLNRIVFSPELGGQPPSQLMRTLLTHLPAGEPAGLLFKHLFLLRLPEDLREQVSKKIERLDARELAEYADTRWHVWNAKRSGGRGSGGGEFYGPARGSCSCVSSCQEPAGWPQRWQADTGTRHRQQTEASPQLHLLHTLQVW